MHLKLLCNSFHWGVPGFLKKKSIAFPLNSAGFRIEKTLQDGKHSQIILAKDPRGTLVILKKLDSRYIREELIENEIMAGVSLSKHKNIAKLYGHFREGDYVYLILEYVPGVDLFDYLQVHGFKPLRENEAKNIFKQIVKATRFIHKKGFVHRDLKLENVMLTHSNKAKIIDFGLCAKSSCDSILNSFLGSVEYACPEILARKPYVACKAEVWSLGVLLFALLHGQFPFSAFDREKKFDVELCFPIIDSRVSSLARDLVSNMLVVEPNLRYDLDMVANHLWLKC